MRAQPQATEDPFFAAFRGRFTSLMSWADLDDFWERVRSRASGGWYLYAVGQPVPTAPASADQVLRFVHEVDALLRHDHHEDYCGIVYTDNKTEPTFIKIFDPHNLGASCGSSAQPPLPGWIVSRIAPRALEDRTPLPANRRRWWQRLWT